MICVAGLTPAWQQILTFHNLQLGEVNRANTAHWCASGKVLNCGLALHTLNAECVTLSPAGGINGAAMKQDFLNKGATAKWVDSIIETRICTTVISQDSSTVTELVENSRAMPQKELDEYLAAYKQTASNANLVVLTGSLPAGTSPDYYRQLLEQSDTPAILDFRGAGLQAALQTKPLLVKPNREELEATLDTKFSSESDMISGMRQLNSAGAKWVLVTQGAGTVYLTSETECYQYHSLSVPVVNAIGCGDCFTAGLAWAIQNGKSIPESVPFGIAAAADNLQKLLPAQLEPHDVTELATQVKWEARP